MEKDSQYPLLASATTPTVIKQQRNVHMCVHVGSHIQKCVFLYHSLILRLSLSLNLKFSALARLVGR